MGEKMQNKEKLNVQLRGAVADKFRRIKSYLGLENDTEVIRALITWYYTRHEPELTGPPKLMWHLNLNEHGVLVWDPDLRQGVQVLFSRNGIKCEHCENESCKHVQFALAQPDIKKVIQKRQKEGWKLPEV